jgi:hypothetical protein
LEQFRRELVQTKPQKKVQNLEAPSGDTNEPHTHTKKSQKY